MTERPVTFRAGALSVTGTLTVTDTAPARTAGAAPLGTVTYPAPADAVWVATTGSDTTGTGAKAAPYATLRKALAATATGGTVVLRGGEYREKVGDITRPVTIQPAPGEAVWFDGSDVVTGWVANGDGTWTAPFVATFDHSESFQQGVTYLSGTERFVDKTNYPMAAWPDAVFIDGARQRQVPPGIRPGSGQFTLTCTSSTEWQHTTSHVTIGTDPTGRQVRCGRRELWATVKAPCVIRGIGVRRYSTSLYMQGTINIVQAGAGTHLDNCWVVDSATEAVSANGKGTKVTGCSIIRPGMNGIQGNRCEDIDIIGNWVDEANWEWFNAAPAAGALKFNRAVRPNISWNVFTGSHRSGAIWTDTSSYGGRVIGNDIRDNDGTPIWIEASEDFLVANNHTSSAGAMYGIGVWISGTVRVWNNTVGDTTNWQVGLCSDTRRNTEAATKDAAPWVCRDNEVVNNVFGVARRWFQFYAWDGRTDLPAATRCSRLDGNAFVTATPMVEPYSRRIGWDTPGVTGYADPAVFAAAVGKAWVNTVVTDPARVDHTKAVPLPADIAAELGVPAGTRRVGPVAPPPTIRSRTP